MDTWVGWLIGVAVVVAAVFLLPWLAQRTMDNAGGGGSGGGSLGALQEIFHPAAHRAEASIVEQKERAQPAAKGAGDDDEGADAPESVEPDRDEPPYDEPPFDDGARL